MAERDLHKPLTSDSNIEDSGTAQINNEPDSATDNRSSFPLSPAHESTAIGQTADSPDHAIADASTTSPPEDANAPSTADNGQLSLQQMGSQLTYGQAARRFQFRTSTHDEKGPFVDGVPQAIYGQDEADFAIAGRL